MNLHMRLPEHVEPVEAGPRAGLQNGKETVPAVVVDAGMIVLHLEHKRNRK